MYGLAVVCAPAIGPTLGGYITDNFNWRWIFFLNIPVCLLSLFLTSRIVEDPPWIEKEVKESQKGGIKLDLIGFALLALTFGSLEFVLDKGQEDDWFASHIITFFAVACVVAFVVMIWWELTAASRGAPADPEPHAVQATKFCDQLHADVCARLRAVWHDDSDSAVCADAARVYGGALGESTVSGAAS